MKFLTKKNGKGGHVYANSWAEAKLQAAKWDLGEVVGVRVESIAAYNDFSEAFKKNISVIGHKNKAPMKNPTPSPALLRRRLLVPFMGGRPKRDDVIQKDDVTNLKILLNTTETLTKFLTLV